MESVTARVTVPLERVRSVVIEALVRRGAPRRPAELTADSLLRADLRGQPSHGLLRLPTICGRMAAGLIDPEAELDVTRPAPAVALVDGRRGLGHVVAWEVTDLMADVVAETGVCIASITNANHIGMAGIYAEHAAERGNVMIVTSISETLVRPHGGTEPLLGTNPIAIGVPAEPDPFVLDMSTAASSIGRLIEYRDGGRRVPEDWAVDAEGRATEDPAAALEGAINPYGGAKGYGLALAVALLAGGLTGAAMGSSVTGTLDVEDVCNKGDLFIMASPRFFLDGDTLSQRVTAYLDAIRASQPAPGNDRVLIPGDRGRAREAEARLNGLELRTSLWEEVQAL